MPDQIISLLEKISSSQLDDLILEHQLSNEGYRFNYALDNHDFKSYCFPLGLYNELYENLADAKIDVESDKIVAYDDFFSGNQKDCIIFFLNEYAGELLALRARIIELNETGLLTNYATTFEAYMESEEYKDNEDGVYGFTLFISIATGLLHDGSQRFNKVFYTPYFVFNGEQLHELAEPEPFLGIFDELEDPLERSQIEWVSGKLKGLKHKRSAVSSLIDSEAIIKVLSLNKRLLKEYKEKKTLLFFLSTTESCKEFFKENLALMPKVNEQAFNFHRTVEQLFINRLLSDLPYKDKMERLQVVRELVKFREDNPVDIELNDPQTYVVLKTIVVDKFKDLRERYIEAHLARKNQFVAIQELYNQSMEVTKGGNKGKLTRFFNRLQKKSREIGGKNNLSLIKDLENTFQMEQIFVKVFKKAIVKLLEGRPLVLSRGKDSIQSTGHHLPIVFRYRTKGATDLFNDIAAVYLSQIAFYTGNQNRDQDLTAVNRLKELTSSVSEFSLGTKTIEEKLFFCLYLLILPDAELLQGKSNSIYVQDFLLELNTQIRSGKTDRDLLSDYFYILAWVLRRNVDYSEAKKVTEEALNEFPDDARFIHSEVLLKICNTPKTRDKAILSRYYKNYLEDIYRAQHLYAELLEGKDHIIRTNINAALLNSEIYTHTLIYSVAEDNEKVDLKGNLHDLRVNKLAALKEMLGSLYTEYPEFLHTEAFLEYYETDLELTLEGKISKLSYAENTLQIGKKKASALPGFKLKNFDELLHKIEMKKPKI